MGRKRLLPQSSSADTSSSSDTTFELDDNDKFKKLFNYRLGISERIGLNELYLCGIEDFQIQDSNSINTVKQGVTENGITKLSIVGCKLDESCIIFMKHTMKNLIKLDLSYNCIGSVGAWHLADGIQNSSSLTSLNICSNQICGMCIQRFDICGTIDLTGLQALFDSFLTCSSLKLIDLGSNYLGGFSIDPTSTAYSNSVPMDNQQSASELAYGTKVIQIITQFLEKNKSVQDLNLSSNGFEDRSDYANSILAYVGKDKVCQSVCGRLQKVVYPIITNVYGVPIENDDRFIPTFDFRGSNLTHFSGRLLGHEVSAVASGYTLNLSNNVEVS